MKSHGPFRQHEKAIRVLVLAIGCVVVATILAGCAVNTGEDGLARTRPVTILCVLAACETEHADHTGTVKQEEGAQDLSPDVEVGGGAVEGVAETLIKGVTEPDTEAQE